MIRPFSIGCWIVGLWYELRHGTRISGHDYVEVDDDVLVCRTCGKESR